MKQLFIYICIACLAAASCEWSAHEYAGRGFRSAANAPEWPQPHADTVYTREAAMAAMANHPERALAIIDSACIVGNVSDYMADMLRMKVYSQSLEGFQLDSSLAIGERLMHHDSTLLVPDNRLKVLDLLLTVARLNSDDEQLLLLTEQKSSLCREMGDEVEALRTEVERGVALTRLGHMEEGMMLIDNVIDRLDGIRRFNEMDTWIIAMRRKIGLYQELPGSYGVIESLSLRILTRLEDYSQYPDDYNDGTFREPAAEERPLYVDYYRSKCYAYLADACSVTDPEAARRYLSLYERTEYGKTYNGRVMIAPTLCRLGEFGKMEEIYREVDARHEYSDSLNTIYLNMLHDRAVAAEAGGRTQDALSLWKRYDVLKGIMADRTISGKAHYYAASYQSGLQQKALEQEQAKKSRLINLAWVLGALVLLLLSVMTFGLLKFRKNIRVARVYAAASETSGPRVPDKRPSAMDDNELFQYISGIIKRDGLYLNPMLDRQALLSHIGGLSAHRLGAAFSKGSEHHSLPGYIRSLRLEHACMLLLSRPDLTVKAVGEASGFSNNSTFCSDFKACYGLTPSDYRKAGGI